MAKHKSKSNGHAEAPAPSAEPTATIQGVTFTVPQPYSEGHTLSATEAMALNQLMAENLRNNFSDRVKKAKAAAGLGEGDEVPADLVDELRKAFADYATGYQFHAKRAAGPKADPVVKEARKLARQIVSEQARKKGIDLKTLPDGRMDQLIDQLLAKNTSITEEARTRVESAKRVASEGMEELFSE